ncbi:MAG TPA: hypothetical protein VJH22_00615 [Candidatus Nanoarchaeia archaeon]|nr:hypothetical protein [Candidatus Nanoarchaeia archaeon]
MIMEPFYNKCPEIAEKETRCIVVMNDEEGLPRGGYHLLESYCNRPNCDCRRVFINVLHKDKILATIGYGWERVEFYEQWLGKKDLARDMKGPILELTGQHTEYSQALLKLFEKVILSDGQFITRLKTHYDLFKKNLAKDSTEELSREEFNPEKYTIVELCKDTGTGLDCITDNLREAFYPILMTVEETIWKRYVNDSSLKDSEVIESLKKIRDHIFSEDTKFNELEENIIKMLKAVLFVNNYSKRDLSLSISNVLNSAKRHRSMDGSRGYVTFISTFFDQMRDENNDTIRE